MRGPLASLAALLLLTAAGNVHAQGVGRGSISIVDTETHAYGYSVFPDSAYWVDAPLSGSVLDLSVGDYVGAVITTSRAYLFNGVSNRWFSSAYTGSFLGSDARGAVAVFWTDRAVYGIASIWASWRGLDLLTGEIPLGGGSTGDYAIVWTTMRAMAFNPGTGQWASYELGEPVINGAVLQKIALVWTQHSAAAFDSNLNTWIPTALADATGASVDDQGGGDVAILWGMHEAHVFVDSADGWFVLSDPVDTIRGGSASGQVGVVWSEVRAHVFDAPRQRWSAVALEGQGRSGVEAPAVFASSFGVFPNPTRMGAPTFRLGASAWAWNVEVIDVAGRRVRSFVVPGAPVERTISWAAAPGSPEPLPTGSYWIRARSGDRFEARRIVVLD
jgi:hypothetical protein